MSGTPADSALLQLLPFALILVVFYFLLIRPQQQKAKETEAMLEALKPGDNVVTTGGLFGKIVKIQENEVSLEIASNVKIRLERSSVGQVVKAGKAAESTKS
ncbi:MAG: preprotein translocase subunit YajC [Candidatus Binatia bacterium]|jgi:preprotein translocase subunit YajC|nr:preprotein translocase subunit YajC [Candidatus Binatia bacterium]MDG1958703.1 preprotein translocase subunit YajC [Candidatus Binatia bacterium]MDG2008988.1 preprotein translocase subunit YajC [Candidatus Binatia bacterium]